MIINVEQNKTEPWKAAETFSHGEFVRERIASQVSGLSVAQLRKFRRERTGPPVYKVGTAVFYNVLELLTWIKGQRVV